MMNSKQGKLPNAYSTSSVSKDTLRSSSSGGVFLNIATFYLEQPNGVVYGAAFCNGHVLHKRVDNIFELNNLAKSKYIQSEIGSSFIDCMQDLENDKHVFFVGTPCQIASLHHFLTIKKISVKKLLTADLFCHGVPKLIFWEQYLREKHCNDINNVDFRYKKPSWEKYSLRMEAGKNIYCEHYSNNEYFNAFLKNYILSEGCYTCKFKGENRFADLSLGDFWGVKKYYPELYNPRGTSLIIVRNKHDDVINILKQRMNIKKVKYSVALLSNSAYYRSARKPDDYNAVMKSVQEKGFLSTFNVPKESETPIGMAISYFKKLLKRILLIRGSNRLGNEDTIILTDHGFSNFGNRLQNYALRKVLEKNGKKPANIYLEKKYLYSDFLKTIRSLRLKDNKRKKAIHKACIKSGEKDVRFDYLTKPKRKIIGVKNIVVGSDQIWNWTYHKTILPFCLAMFCSGETMNKISYGASFGTNYISEDFIDCYKDGLSDFNAISVRENAAIGLIKKLGFDSELVLDPTLLLRKDDWDYAIKKYKTVKRPDKKYILKYILGDNCTRDEKNVLDLPIIDVLDSKSEFFIMNHFDFVMLISEAEIVYTDSYHAFIFSLIFGKKVMLLSRKEMSSRFESLMDLLNIKYSQGELLDLSRVDIKKLSSLRQKSLLFLKQHIE